MSTPKDNFESRVARVFGGLEKSSGSNPLAEKAIPQDSLGKGGNKPLLQSKWNRTTHPRLDSPESDDGIEANSGSDEEEDGPVVANRKEYRHAVPSQIVPDHMQNPQKWKKYDLSEDGEEETEFKGLQGDQLNKRVAFQFLGDLRKRKNLEQGVRLDDEDDDQRRSDDKILFQRPRPRDAQSATAAAAATRGGSGVVTMPQYEFGGKPPAQKRAKVVGTRDFDLPKSDEEEEDEDDVEEDDEYAYKGAGAKKNVQLPHLINVAEKEDDDDDDDEGSGDLKIYDVGSDDSNPDEVPSPRTNEVEGEEGSKGEEDA